MKSPATPGNGRPEPSVAAKFLELARQKDSPEDDNIGITIDYYEDNDSGRGIGLEMWFKKWF